MENVIAQGAEGTVVTTTWRGRSVVRKVRTPKGYRHAQLDAQIRAERTRREARAIMEARALGVRVPVVYDVDEVHAALTIEAVEGEPLKHRLEAGEFHWLEQLGKDLGRMHAGHLTHGDPTTSNVMVSGSELVWIDFGLSVISVEDEDFAVDLHLVEEALEALHDVPGGFDRVWAGYEQTHPHAAAVLKRLDAVRARGRYRRMQG